VDPNLKEFEDFGGIRTKSSDSDTDSDTDSDPDPVFK
jgi:hypothetical protein